MNDAFLGFPIWLQHNLSHEMNDPNISVYKVVPLNGDRLPVFLK